MSRTFRCSRSRCCNRGGKFDSAEVEGGPNARDDRSGRDSRAAFPGPGGGACIGSPIFRHTICIRFSARQRSFSVKMERESNLFVSKSANFRASIRGRPNPTARSQNFWTMASRNFLRRGDELLIQFTAFLLLSKFMIHRQLPTATMLEF